MRAGASNCSSYNAQHIVNALEKPIGVIDFTKTFMDLGMVAHTYNPSIWKIKQTNKKTELGV